MNWRTSRRDCSLISATLCLTASLKPSSELLGYVELCWFLIFFFNFNDSRYKRLEIPLFSSQIGAVHAVSREAYFTAIESEDIIALKNSPFSYLVIDLFDFIDIEFSCIYKLINLRCGRRLCKRPSYWGSQKAPPVSGPERYPNNGVCIRREITKNIWYYISFFLIFRESSIV